MPSGARPEAPLPNAASLRFFVAVYVADDSKPPVASIGSTISAYALINVPTLLEQRTGSSALRYGTSRPR